MARWIWLVLLPLGACAYDPGLRGDRMQSAYATDLAACQDGAGKTADAEVKRRFYSFIGYPVFEPLAERRAVRDCLRAKGYAASE